MPPGPYPQTVAAPKIELLKPQTKKKQDPARVLARRLLKRPEHLKTLKKKLDDGSLHPSIQVALMYYAYGKPKESLELTGADGAGSDGAYLVTDSACCVPPSAPQSVRLRERRSS